MDHVIRSEGWCCNLLADRPAAHGCILCSVNRRRFVVYPLWVFVTYPPSNVGDFFAVLAMGLLWACYIAVFALIPSIAALTLVRMTRLRRGFTDTIAGGIVGALTITLIDQLGRTGLQFDDGDLFRAAQYGLAGMAGGLTFWFANGRPTNPRAR